MANLAFKDTESYFGYHNSDKVGPAHKILLVDDHEPNLLIAGTYLAKFGYDFDIAQSGADAVEKIRSNQYLAILMDIQMPGMDGIETAMHIRCIEYRAGRPRQPIIALTAHPLAGDSKSCYVAGMDAYVSKPFNPESLKNLLAGFIQQ